MQNNQNKNTQNNTNTQNSINKDQNKNNKDMKNQSADNCKRGEDKEYCKKHSN